MKKLAILGASYLQLPLVEKANAMGIETHCFAWDNEDAVCKHTADFFYPLSVLEKELILEECRRIDIDGICTIATDICIPTISFVAEKLQLLSNSYASGILATNKGAMKNAFIRHGIDSPKSIVFSGSENDLPKKLNFPLIVKPTDRSGSRGVQKVFEPHELQSAIATALAESLENKAIVEEFVEGDEISVESISWKGQHYILAITDKITNGSPHFVEMEHHQPSLLDAELQEKVKHAAIKTLDALEIKYGAGHLEFKIDKSDNIFAIEAGARMGGDFIGSHLVKLSTGFDFLAAVINIALGEFDVPVIRKEQYAGVYFLSLETERLMPYFSKENTFDFEKEIFTDELKTSKNSNNRAGYLIYCSDKKIRL